ncbi:MAG: response regulator transcription factor [Bacteroidales bacterium]|jgi:two-component system alkaline phosphatase synthesis response regulator PhoP|nr:response regulator transcription factor [Bacteroidales bacterium]
MNSEYTILLVDDENDIREFLSYTLRKEGFIVHTAEDGKSGISKATEVKPHLILLDIMMPGINGIEACEKIRSDPDMADVIICFLTAKSEDSTQIAGFEAGGDDYIIKPVKPKLLVSRVRALLRRYRTVTNEEQESVQVLGSYNLSLDRERFILHLDDEDIFLPRKEFELLSLLLTKPGKVFTRTEIFKRVWGENIIVGDRTIDVHIRKLREKVGAELIQTIKGVGYKLME